MAPRRFAQRAWLPQERECGLEGPAFSAAETSEQCGGCPSPSPGAGLGQSRAGKVPGRENVPTQSWGSGCSWSQGAAQGSGVEREVEGRH